MAVTITWQTYNVTTGQYLTGDSYNTPDNEPKVALHWNTVSQKQVISNRKTTYSGSQSVGRYDASVGGGLWAITTDISLGAGWNQNGLLQQSDIYEIDSIDSDGIASCTPPWTEGRYYDPDSSPQTIVNGFFCRKTSSTAFTVSGRINFLFKIKNRQYSIKYYSHESEISPPPGLPSSYTAGYGISFTLPDVSEPGYIWGGWYDNPSFTGNPITNVTISTSDTGDRAYYAKFTTVQVVVVFDPQGGIIAGNYFKIVTSASAYGTLPTPSRSGYTFSGWYTSSTGGTQVTSSTIVTSTQDHTIYAHWTSESVQYTLYFNANGGEVSESSRLVYSGTAYGALPTPTWAYHTFVGWFTEPYGGAQVSAETTMGDDDATIYAHWTDDTTTVTFNGNGGEPSTQTITYPSGSKYGSLPSATRSGYILTGWFTAATGGTRVEPSDVVSAQTLYAQWQTSSGTAEGVIWNKDTDFVIEMPAQ
jgi:uncharacterized repeat protein (TIGR02543 family)